ncbi:acetate/propionate family kinase [Marinimicrobium sp. ABcell2]|uniref:acetate/propionate family kinase n=1 Tax=Marinimicrobium sp. ABcell2 TaxID=3069751 RepID=UPI0027B7ABAF|nr:acetate kinase [Marinimicrobium sp. ABcell2]MDQ2078400.1 acetate kinase [Marinimicrobium sp. ABcell2]
MISAPVLVINSGSSSLKFSVFDMNTGGEAMAGLAERLESGDAQLSWRERGGDKQTLPIPHQGHEGALLEVHQVLKHLGSPLAVGHRVVHGGEAFSDSVLIDDAVIAGIDDCASLAPLHNPANVLGIRVMQKLYPQIPQVAVFDTAFHQTLAERAYLYAIPMHLYRDHGVRRYGFHGTSHKYVAAQAVERLSLDPANHGIITAHLGNGCSATAVRNGHSVDTTMGMTPLEGLVMGTRSGDVDPGLHEYLAESLNMSLAEITAMLNRESGLLGLSGLSNDMRTLTEAAEQGNADAQRAIDVFCFRLARQIGALAASLERLDALVFTGGIGENASPIRGQVLAKLPLFGFSCDAELNQRHGDERGIITTADSVPALVIGTREEWVIAHDAYQLSQT